MMNCDQATEASINFFDLYDRLYISFHVFLLFPFTVLRQLLFRLIDKNSQDNHRAHSNELPERIYSQENETILDNRDNERADHRADDGPLTPQERGATDNYCR